jgi:hypothetical protein
MKAMKIFGEKKYQEKVFIEVEKNSTRRADRREKLPTERMLAEIEN